MSKCSWCGENFDAPHSKGPRPTYCKPSCRQRAYEARRITRPDERAVALVVEWWMRIPVADYDGPEPPEFQDVKALFDHLHANGYTITQIPVAR